MWWCSSDLLAGLARDPGAAMRGVRRAVGPPLGDLVAAVADARGDLAPGLLALRGLVGLLALLVLLVRVGRLVLVSLVSLGTLLALGPGRVDEQHHVGHVDRRL